MLRLLPTLLVMALGAALLAQAPEFAQQYRQRLGGALDELRAVTADFERDAARSNLSRGAALGRMNMSTDDFVRDRGLSMSRTVARFERLERQAAALEAAPPLLRPVAVLRQPDGPVLRAAWSAFEPAVPLTAAGLTWGSIGAVLFALAFWLGRGLFGLAGLVATRPRIRGVSRRGA